MSVKLVFDYDGKGLGKGGAETPSERQAEFQAARRTIQGYEGMNMIGRAGSVGWRD